MTTHGAVTGKAVSILLGPRFLIDFDQLTFHFAALGGPQVSAQLLVQGRVVLSVDAADVEPETMTRILWPVSAWQGRIGRMRFIDRMPRDGYLAVDHIRSHRYTSKTTYDDFDAGVYGERWASGFGERPTPFEASVARLGPRFVVGRFSASSLSLDGRREMVSAPFIIEHQQISFLVFDLGGERTRVRLKVGGRYTRRFVGRNSGKLRGVTWNVPGLLGRQATLEVVDYDPRPWKGIGIDEIVFGDP